MRNFTLVVVLFLVSWTGSYGQNAYSDYVPSYDAAIFTEEFLSNDYGWYEGTDENCRIYDVQPGYLELQSKCTGDYTTMNFNNNSGFTIDTSRDFEIEISIYPYSGEDNNSHSLGWGKDAKKDDRYSFGISRNGQFIISKYSNGAWSYLKDWTTSSVINTTGYNKLTIRKVNFQYYFFINESLVHNAPFESFFGQRLSMQCNQNSIGRFDNIHIRYIRKSEPVKKYEPPIVVSTIGESSYNDFSTVDKEIIFSDDFSTNTYGWYEGRDDNCRIFDYQPGFLQLESICTGSYTTMNFNSDKGFFIDDTRDFEIEISVYPVSGEDDNGNSLSWGKSNDGDNRFMFGITRNGQFSIWKYNGNWVSWKEWTESSLINTQNYNLLTIRKVGSYYSFFINKVLVHQQPFESFFGQRLSMQSNQNAVARFDNIRIAYLHKQQGDKAGPTITLFEPEVAIDGRVEESNKQILVKGRAYDGSGLFEVSVNGEEATIHENSNFEALVRLGIGDNRIVIKASDTKNNFSEFTFTIHRSEAQTLSRIETKSPQLPGDKKVISDVDINIPKGSIQRPDAIAVVIGNRDYTSTKSVDFAINDARIVKEYLINSLGFQEGNILYYENATKGQFEMLFGTEMNEKGKLFNTVMPGFSDVFVFYSGHGAPGLKDQKGYFVPVECDPNYVEISGFDSNVFYKNLGKLPAKSVTVVLDACFSGANVFSNISPIVIKAQAATRPDNINVLGSSSGSQVSSWYNDKGHGLFTYFFLKSLQDKTISDKNGDGSVSLREIHQVLSDNVRGVPYWARRLHGIEQTPTLEGRNPDFVLFK
ncbi:MAG: hypothetical protein RL161_371 [Bacteroidota bacterium]